MNTRSLTKGARHAHPAAPARTMRSLSTDTMGDFSSALSLVGSGSLHSSRTLSVGRLRMAQDFNHQPVLLAEVTELFSTVPTGVIIDATLGGAGHAAALLDSRDDIAIVGIDRDPDAIVAARRRLSRFAGRAAVVEGRFSEVAAIVAAGRHGAGAWPELDMVAAPAPVVGILADLGVSSPQLDRAERGFSFAQDGPLDMRMDPTSGRSASALLESMDEHELTALLRENGEGRHARRIARAVLAARPIATTQQLVDVIDRAVPRAGRRKGHVAARAFQGLRIAVNREIDELALLLDQAPSLLAPGGRLAVIAYHSGEDALVKHQMRAWADGDCTCPPGLPCVCGATSSGTLISRRAVVATPEEIVRNPRARSARLRCFEVGK